MDMMDIAVLLALSIRNHASDLHLSAGLPPMLRVHGQIRRVNMPPLAPAQLQAMLDTIMPAPQQQQLATQRACDFAFAHERLGRFRINVYYQQGTLAAAIRPIASQLPRLDQLGSPSACAALSLRASGLVLLTGATGSGKSSTLAAMLGHINAQRAAHVLTIEDPIEFVHDTQRSLFSQRQLGQDTHCFASALEAAMRQDPDVIMVGELRDAATIRLALTAAETGHLVLATLHAGSAVKALDRIVDAFGAGEQDSARAMLAECLQGVVWQALLPTADGQGRVAAHEVLLASSAVRHLVREGKSAQIASAMQAAGSSGMQTLDQSLAALLRAGRISSETARMYARSPDSLPT